MPKFTMMVGVPGSGKSTRAKELSLETGAVIMSSDALRFELFGDETSQEDNNLVFQELHKRTKEALASGKDVIYDATNTNRKKRKHLLSQLGKDVEKRAMVLPISYHAAIMNDKKRERIVGEDVIRKFIKSFHIPQVSEGWDHIELCYKHKDIDPRIDVSDLDFHRTQEFFLMNDYCGGVLAHPQNNPFHTLSVDRHIYKAYKYVRDNYHGSDKELVLLASLYHDVGKPFCRETNPETLYDSFFGHENVSAQIAAMNMLQMGYSTEDILMVTDLVQHHMLFLNEEKHEKERKKVHNKKKAHMSEHDPYRFKLLELLRRADVQAK